MLGTCSECIDKQKTQPGYTCPLCALGLNLGSENVIKDPFNGTVHIDLSNPNHPFWGNNGFYGNKVSK